MRLPAQWTRAGAVDEVRQGVREIEHHSDPTRGEVRIGPIADPTLVPYTTSLVGSRASILASRITSLSAMQLRCCVNCGSERSMWCSSAGTSKIQTDDLAAEVLYKSTLAVMANKRHPLVHRKEFTLADLVEEQWTLPPPNSFMGRVWVDLFRRRRLPLFQWQSSRRPQPSCG